MLRAPCCRDDCIKMRQPMQYAGKRVRSSARRSASLRSASRRGVESVAIGARHRRRACTRPRARSTQAAGCDASRSDPGSRSGRARAPAAHSPLPRRPIERTSERACSLICCSPALHADTIQPPHNTLHPTVQQALRAALQCSPLQLHWASFLAPRLSLWLCCAAGASMMLLRLHRDEAVGWCKHMSMAATYMF